MQKSHNMVKHFSSTITKCKNYNDELQQHRCLPTNQLEQDHDGTRIVVACKLMKSSLRMKRGTAENCREFKMPEFVTEEDWRTVREFEGNLHKKSRWTKVCQNEEKLNGVCGPVMRKYLCDILSRSTMLLMNTE